MLADSFYFVLQWRRIGVLKGLCLQSDSELAWHWAGPQALMATMTAPASSPVAGRRPGSLSARTSQSWPGESK